MTYFHGLVSFLISSRCVCTYIIMLDYESIWYNVCSQNKSSWVHMHNLHPANLHPGCIFGHVNGVLRICKFAPTFDVHPGANLHSGAICAYERKMFNFYTF